jgi:hypothetical protein
MANTLHLIPNKIEKSTYVKMVAKILGQNRSNNTGIIASNEENEARAKRKSTGRTKEFEILGLPEGADKDQFLTDPLL